METGFLEQTQPAGFGLGGSQAPAALDQGHLGGKVAAFTNFHTAEDGKELHKIKAAVTAGTGKPERV